MFHSTFRRIGSAGDFSPEAWAESFRPSARSLWEQDLGGAVSHRDPDGVRRALILAYLDGAVSISYDDGERYWIAAPRDGLASEFTLAGNGATIPVRSAIELEAAWAIVEQFLRAPTRRPAATWVDAATLDWPEDY